MISAQSMTGLIENYGYLALFALAVLEGPVATILAGVVAASGHLEFWAAYFTVTLGDLVGDAAFYAAGRRLDESLLRSKRRFFTVKAERLRKAARLLSRKPGKALLIGKWTHAIGGAVLLAAGMARVPFWTFITFNLIGTMPKALAFLLLGYSGGMAVLREDNHWLYGVLALLLIGVGALAFIIRQRDVPESNS